LANHPCAEYMDVFTKRKYYDQSLTRYHTQPEDVLTRETEPQPIELSFLASLYSGFNGEKMTSAQYHEIENQLKNFPAQSLARKIKNSNLNSLRKTLFELDLKEEMLTILKRKYFPRKLSKKSITIDEHMRDLNLTGEIQGLVKSCLRASGRSEKTTLIRNYEENTDFKSKQQVEMENLEEKKNKIVDNSQLKSDTKQVKTLLIDRTAGADWDRNKSPGIDNYVDGLISEDQLTEQQILEIFGVDELVFKNKLRPVIQNILELFYYLKTGNLLEKEHDFKKLNVILESENIEQIYSKTDLSLGAILKLLVLLMSNLHSNKFFLKNSLIKMPFEPIRDKTGSC
jgi:hypothetical protein